MTHKRTRTCTIGCVCFLGVMLISLTSGLARPAGETSVTDASLVPKVRFTKEQFKKLVTEMTQVASLLEKSDPQTAKVLTEAVNQAQRAWIARDMDKVAELLTKGLAAAAKETGGVVGAELRRVLDILRHGVMSAKDRKIKIDKMKKLRDQINDIIEKQKDLEEASRFKNSKLANEMARINQAIADLKAKQQKLLNDTQKLPEPDKDVQKLSDLREEVRKLIAEQKQIDAISENTPPRKLPMVGAVQKALSRKTAEVQKKIKDAASDKGLTKKLADKGADPKTMDKAASQASKAGKQMDQAANELAKGNKKNAQGSQGSAMQSLKAAEKSLSEAMEKASGQSGAKASKMAGEQKKLADAAKELAKDIDKASKEAGSDPEKTDLNKSASHMDKASKKLNDGKPKDAAEEMKMALKELEEKKLKLAQLTRKVKEKAKQPTDKQASDQTDLAQRTNETAKQMDKTEKSPSMPGQKATKSAAGKMKSAAGALGQGKSSQANEDQKEALKDLENAKDDLEKAIEEEQEKMQLESLVKIDAELQKILNTQKTISAATKTVDSKHESGKPFDRAEEIELTRLAAAEGKLAKQIDRIRKKLLDEGTTAVFPAVLKEVGDDIRSVDGNLSNKNPGKLTQRVQSDIETTLQEMIDAIRKEMSKRRKPGGGGGGGKGGGGGGKKPPLVSNLAELKMLYRLQRQIQRRTIILADSKPGKDGTKKQIGDMHKKLAGRQSKVKSMTEELKNKSKAGR
jgi:hypothetical protein